MDKRDAKVSASGSDKCPNHPLGGSHSFVPVREVLWRGEPHEVDCGPEWSCPGCGARAADHPYPPPTLEDEMDAGEALADGLDYPDLED